MLSTVVKGVYPSFSRAFVAVATGNRSRAGAQSAGPKLRLRANQASRSLQAVSRTCDLAWRPHGVPRASPGHVCSDIIFFYPFAFLPMAMAIQSLSSAGCGPERSTRALDLRGRADEFCLKKGGDLVPTSGQGSGLVFGRKWNIEKIIRKT